MGANVAFCLVIFGLLGIYCEFIWPGRVWQLIAGAAAMVLGIYHLCIMGPAQNSLMLLGLATVLFLLDAFVETFFLAGLAATAALIVGFCGLIPSPNGIVPLLAVPGGLLFGVTTTALNWIARRARRNKSADFVARQ